jgi:hypothetical protein
MRCRIAGGTVLRCQRYRPACAIWNRQSPAERQQDEQGSQQRRLVGLARHQEAEDRAGAGGQHESPHQHGQPRRPRVAVEPALEHRPQVDGDEGDHAGVEKHVPGEHRLEVVVRRRDDHPVRPAQVEHQHHQAAGQQRHAQQARQRRPRLVRWLAEDRADRGDVEHTGCGHDHEDREHVRQAPHHLVGHAGDDVAVRLHLVRGGQPDARDQRAERGEQPETTGIRCRGVQGCSHGHSPW